MSDAMNIVTRRAPNDYSERVGSVEEVVIVKIDVCLANAKHHCVSNRLLSLGLLLLLLQLDDCLLIY